MNTRIQYIPLDKIRPIFQLETTAAYLKRMSKLKKDLLDYDLLLAVEKDQNEDFFYLVGGYDRYDFLCNHTNKKLAPCIVEDDSELGNQRLFKLLHRLSNRGDSTKPNRQSVLDLLKQAQVQLDAHRKKIGFSIKFLRTNYEYDNNIPAMFINSNTSEKTMNWIESLPVSTDVKYFLFERAGLEKGNAKRLSQDSLKIIKNLLKNEPRFHALTPDQQIQVLVCAINFRGIVLSLLKDKVEQLLKVTSQSPI
ncbi:hypothetical protein [Tumebacillus permanentifrigoris]|uniref:Uncharacterized protein n=1 Tax=Tumebacillus permanentifrigoris TaxID=378543 RepID=A0A316DBG0_9BACL|nr:hypothetical protein [Tumebacillus permanentifrigoris]PWK14935.1 hypothetical protein C7459_104137 [Tumebacillus permanentifrigoris]